VKLSKENNTIATPIVTPIHIAKKLIQGRYSERLHPIPKKKQKKTGVTKNGENVREQQSHNHLIQNA